LLCAVHVPEGDPRKIYSRMPEAGERRCTAKTLDGQQCRHWALVQDEEGRELCWLHAYPEEHPQIRHGYYMSPLPLSEVEREAIRLAMASERPLQGEIVLTRILIHMLLAYVTESGLPLGENLHSVRLIIQNVRTVAKLLLTQKEIEGPEEVRGRVQRELERIEREAERSSAGRCGVWECGSVECTDRSRDEDPEQGNGDLQEATGESEGASGLQEEAAALLEMASDPGLAGEIGLMRVLMRRLFKYTTDVGEMPLLEMVRVGQLLIRGLRAVADLVKADQALRPRRRRYGRW
jgi:hypothetical protein